jgi:hypothetical protein
MQSAATPRQDFMAIFQTSKGATPPTLVLVLDCRD